MSQQKKYDVFISYSRKDSVVADKICSAFDQVGITYFIDRKGMGGTANYVTKIANEIDNSKMMLLLASANSYTSKYVAIELHYAFNHDVVVLPYALDDIPTPKDFEILLIHANWHYLKINPIFPNLLTSIAELIGKQITSKLNLLTLDAEQNIMSKDQAEQERLRKEKELQERITQAEAAKKALEEKTRLAEEKARKAEERANQIEKSHLAERQVRKEEQREATVLSWEDAKENAQRLEGKKVSGTYAAGAQRHSVEEKPNTKNILEVMRNLGGVIGVVVSMAIGGILIFGPTDPTIYLYQDPNKLYEKGLEKEKNSNNEDIAIFEYYRRAAKKGHPAAMNRVALHYIVGMNGVRQNSQKAIEWFNKAIENGNAEAALNLGYVYETGKGVKQDQTEAIKYYTIAAERGLVVAQHRLGDYYFTGTKVEKDQVVAVNWYKRAAENGYAAAQAMLGKCYQYGYGVSQDINQAISWYTKAAEQGHSEAQSDLGQCYALGSGVKRDYVTAVKWFTKAAEQGSSWSQNRLGHIYYDGAENVAKNYTEAIKWFHKAADQGNEYSMYGLGKCYYNGYGVKKDLAEAKKWLTKAANQGHRASKKLLEEIER